MPKKILALCGSPRKKGNTNTLLDQALAVAKKAGNSITVLDVAQLKYKTNGCTACFGCQKQKAYRCVIKDEATPHLAKIPEYDTILFATPVYFFGPTAQTKLFLDRWLSLIKEDLKKKTFVHPFKGKTLALLATAGGDLKGGIQVVEESFKIMAGFLEMNFVSLLVPGAPSDPKDLSKKPGLAKKVAAFGKVLANS